MTFLDFKADLAYWAAFLIFLSFINTALYLIASKVKIIDLYLAYRRKWMPDLCEFCLFFWMAFCELLFNVYSIKDFIYIFVSALCCAVLSRKLL